MTKTLLEKMFCKSNYSIATLHVPEGLQEALHTTNKTDTALKENYHFILGFYTRKEELEREVAKIREALLENGLLWIAYPKAKALQTDMMIYFPF